MAMAQPNRLHQGRTDVVVALRRLVEDGKQIPPERRLSEELGANRYVVRQAMRTLREEGVMPASKRVRHPLWRHEHVLQHTNPTELWEMRLTFEPQIARLAALHGTPQELQEIAELHAFSQPDTFDRELDVAFHLAVATASHNRLALFLVEKITDITRDPGFQLQYPPMTRETGYRHHAAIVSALAQRRPAAAEKMMATHLRAINLWAQGLAPSEEA
jgi:DNA-binding FadR family transcriptional regulator